jgi:hypothetical protein
MAERIELVIVGLLDSILSHLNPKPGIRPQLEKVLAIWQMNGQRLSIVRDVLYRY